MQMVKTLTANFNGITMAYAMGAVNALLAVLLAFGVTMTDQQTAAIVGFVNAALVILAHVGHRLGEAQPLQHPSATTTSTTKTTTHTEASPVAAAPAAAASTPPAAVTQDAPVSDTPPAAPLTVVPPPSPTSG